MGLLSEGTPLTWEETKKLANYVREHGIKQFINLYHKLKDRSKDSLLWGDEVEYMIVAFDKEKKTAKLSLRAREVLDALSHDAENKEEENVWTWHPEYAAYMVEATPGKPYGALLAHLNLVEANMKQRRQEIQKKLRPNEKLFTLTAFPRLGTPNFSDPPLKPTPGEGVTHSLFIPDDTIFAGHPRFKNLTRNIRLRRGEKVAINIPIFKDTNTQQPFVEDLKALGDNGESSKAALPDHIYMDAMAFGMGCCCLQMTFQACSIEEARMLYDQLTPLTPIILALSAASPVQRGYLSDADCRWNVIAASVDDRTREERGLEPLKNDRFVIPKSRYDSIDSYLSNCGAHSNDTPLVIDEDIYKQLKDAGVDALLSQHIAHLFIRDPVSLFSEKINQNDETDTDHFENIQSTNWQTMRFKPPPANSSIGWRVEFRPMEVQLTDFENAAFVVFIVLITRVILSFKLNLVIPISKVDENMKRAQRRDAVRMQTFYFKKDIQTCNTPKNTYNFCSTQDCVSVGNEDYTEMTINEIINGKPGEFSGIIPLIQHYLEDIPDCDVDTMCTLSQYLSLIKKRASGELKTMARWIRDFVVKHPDYRHDSVVSERITYDLVSTCADITDGKPCPELLIKYNTKTTDRISMATMMAESELESRAALRSQPADGITG